MFYVQKLCFIYGFYYFSVECLIPTLNVQKPAYPQPRHLPEARRILVVLANDIDRKLIERKRQDTLDMCRMFTEENNRLERFQKRDDKVVNHNLLEIPKRVKRDLKPPSISLNYAEAERIENIVDKLYDDMAEHGERVTYRQRNLSTVKTPINIQNQTARRFNFAPAMLLPPLPATPETMVDTVQLIQIPWPKSWKHGIIPYFIDSNTYDAHLSDVIIKAFDYFEKATCIRLQRLRERPTDKESLQKVEWIYITNPSGIRQCVHSNEKKANHGVQMIVFGYDCLSLGEILHEIMHILGFSHEHTRPDRDQYLTVLWDNIKPGYKKYFEMRTADPLSHIPYDYSSVLHYPSRAFSKNGQVTLLLEPGVKVGQREGLSDNDIAKVTTIYSPECTKRNKEYLLNTCPRVVKVRRNVSKNVTQNEIEKYFKNRLWPYGIISYKIKNKMEFSSEERENLYSVIRHIEKETCIEFRDISMFDNEENIKHDSNKEDTNLHLHLGKDLINDINKNNTDNEETVDIDDKQSKPTVQKIITITNTNVNEEKNLSKSKTQNSHTGSSETNIVEKDKSKETEENVIEVRKNLDPNTDLTKNSKKHFNNSSKSYSFGSLPLASSQRNKQDRRAASTAGRRHAESTLTLVRSPEPGCRCPPPGKRKGDKVLKINADCFNSVNDLLHLFVHILGLDHQHNMYDRDSFLHILWDNLTPEVMKDMQNVLPPAASVGFPYDYQSVMHYPWLQIKNGVTNIMYPIWNDGWAMGHWQGLSSTDVNKLNLIYYEQCSLRKVQNQQ